MNERGKKILTVQDLSCAGQCSLTVALPILSAFGLETCVLPTAILSEHTMFPHFTFLDLAQNMRDTLASWKEDGHYFSAVLTGYLGRNEHFDIVKDVVMNLAKKDALIVVDPVFGDNGKLYPMFTEKYVNNVLSFVEIADVILPNVTEACFLTGRRYTEIKTREEALPIIKKLAALGNFHVVLTGVEEAGKIGCAVYDRETKETNFYMTERLPGRFHGTGDMFASVFTGAYLAGENLFEASKSAADFVASAIRVTDKEHNYGVQFEKILAEYAWNVLHK